MLLARVLDRARAGTRAEHPRRQRIFSAPPSRRRPPICFMRREFRKTAYIRWGGYDGAERAVLLFLPDWMDASDAGAYSPIRCLRAAFREEENLTHRDFLGSLMGMGIVREKIGDICW